MQQKQTSNEADLTDVSDAPMEGRIVALDLGTKRIGIAVCDETQTLASPVRTIERIGWKKLLPQIKDILAEFDAKALVVGLPLNFEGSESPMSAEARRVARNFSLSLDIPVFLQDERATSYAAKGRLWDKGKNLKQTKALVDSEAAAIILSDFLDRLHAHHRPNSGETNLTGD